MKRADSLTQREAQLLALLRQGYSWTECATLMGISKDGVKKKVRNMRAKVGAESTMELLTLTEGWGV